MRRQRNFIGPQGMGGMVGLWGNPSWIRSTQLIAVAVTGGNVTATGTIIAVDLANAFVLNLGVSFSATGVTPDQAFVKVALTNATTVTATRGGSTNVATVRVLVLEFEPGFVRSVQSVAIQMSNQASVTATINVVNTAKSITIAQGISSNQADFAAMMDAVTLTNATTVTASRGTGFADNTSVAATVIEGY